MDAGWPEQPFLAARSRRYSSINEPIVTVRSSGSA
jgi:hypothetical protein